MSCPHYQTAAFFTKQGDCELCLDQRLKALTEQVLRLKRELEIAQIELGKRLEVD